MLKFFVVVSICLAQWMVQMEDHCRNKINANISPQGARPGTVLASPSKSQPDYYYHWVRDAALTMRALAQDSKTFDLTTKYKFYADLVQYHQSQNGQTGLGEPKFNVDGSVYVLPWGRF